MQSFFKIACAEAERGILSGDGGPFGAIIVKDGKAISKGRNRVISSHDSTAHAEIMAIREAEQALGTHDLRGCEIYTTCYPCPMCLGAIIWARISTVHYACTAQQAAVIGFDDDAMYKAFSTPQSNRFITMKRYNIPEAKSLFQRWLELENRNMY